MYLNHTEIEAIRNLLNKINFNKIKFIKIYKTTQKQIRVQSRSNTPNKKLYTATYLSLATFTI